jgi:hypothetical protein
MPTRPSGVSSTCSGRGGFAILFLFLLGPSALPLPTGGVTQVLEVISIVLALQLMANRDQVWLPRRWRTLDLGSDKEARLLTGLLNLVRRLEARERHRQEGGQRACDDQRPEGDVAGPMVEGHSQTRSRDSLDTLPALGVVLISLAVLFEDFAVAVAGTVVLLAGVVLEIVVGWAALEGLGSLYDLRAHTRVRPQRCAHGHWGGVERGGDVRAPPIEGGGRP